MRKSDTFRVAVLLLLIAPLVSLAAETTGLEVMENVYNRPVGPSMSAELVMTITNSRGATRERSIVQYSLEGTDSDKKIMFFTAPADVRDTSFMTWSWEDGRDDDQWIYLPALRRVKRISSDSKNDSFMGSDFTYDDLGERHPSEDRHTILREETLDGKAAYVVESIPVSPGDAFSRTVTWINKENWVGLKKEYYDGKNKLFKTLTIDSYEKIDGYWVVTDMTMKDLGRESSTRIAMNDVSFSVDLEEDFFTERQMKLGVRR